MKKKIGILAFLKNIRTIQVSFILFFLFPLLAYFLPLRSVHFFEIRTYNYLFSASLFLIFLFYSFFKKKSFSLIISSLEPQFSNKYFFVFVFVSSLFLILSQVFRYYAVEINAIDFSIFDWMLASTWKGHFMYDAAVNSFNHFAIHQNYVLFPLLLFWRIFQSPVFLVVLSPLLVINAGIVLYYFSYLKTRNHFFSAFILVFFLVSPFTAVLLNSNFRPEVFYPFAIFLMFFFLQKKSYFFIFSLFLFLAIKEDAALYGCAFGLSLLFFSPFEKKFSRLMGIIALFCSLLVFLINSAVVQPYFLDLAGIKDAPYLSVWGQWGATKTQIIQNIFSHPGRVLFHVYASDWDKLYAPLLFLPFFSPFILLMSLPGIFLLGLAGQHTFLFHYDTYYPIVLFCFSLFPLIHFFQFARMRVLLFLILICAPLNGVGSLYLPHVRFSMQKEIGLTKKFLLEKVKTGQKVCFQPILLPQFGYSLDILPFNLKNINNKECHFIVFSQGTGIDTYPFTADFYSHLEKTFIEKKQVVKNIGALVIVEQR